VFTDEPSVLGRGAIRDVRPWTWGFETFLSGYLGYDFVPHLEALWTDDYPDAEKYRRDFERAVNARLEEVYYAPYQRWCEEHGVALTGHPAGPGDIGVLKYFHIPGQDIVWRYIEPFKDKSLEGPQSTMAKCSASAECHYGWSRNGNECFGAYGWEFTFPESQWITNWLLARGVNLLMPHAFYYSVRGKRRDERPPDVGPNNTWWDEYKPYADYCRRMCWLIAQSAQVCDVAILGTATQLPWRAARVLFEHQRDFNYLDRDTLLDVCAVDGEGVRIRDMVYKAVVVDGPEYGSEPVLSKLAPMIETGRVVAYAEAVPGVGVLAPDAESLVARLAELSAPDVMVEPRQPGLRYHHVCDEDADMYLFVNEAPGTIRASITVGADGRSREWWNPHTAEVLPDISGNTIEIPPYESRILRCC
ncbi:MAG: glycosyl hydrolase, partial [Candidatus Hydrogenedentota bacterium]